MKKNLLLALCFAFGITANAVPARPMKKQFAQPDGTTVTVTRLGDEFFHYFATLDGTPVLRDQQGAWHYATLSTEGTFAPTTQLAHDAADRTAADSADICRQTLDRQDQSHRNEANARRVARLNARAASNTKLMGRTSQPMAQLNGSHRGLVILVNFKDVKMNSKHTRQVFDDMMNEENHTDEWGNICSVHDYFYAQSYGKFNVSFDVVGPVTVSKKMSYYGQNDDLGNDSHPAQMVVEAIKLAKSQNPDLNFKDYDWNGDGEVDQVFLIYAGYGEASDDDYGSLANTIWPHEYQISGEGLSLTIDGVKIETYGCSCELSGDRGTSLAGIGTPCHEFSHCLGLPDLYDSAQQCFGMSCWSLMDYGCYGSEGSCCDPTDYTAYERWASGWIEPVELSTDASVKNMPALENQGLAYVIYNDAHPDEYYLLENRQEGNRGAYLPSHGMLVTHVDYDKTVWAENTINAKKEHQYCTIIPADNKYDSEEFDGDPFPGSTNNTKLTDTSSPRASLYNANTSGNKLMSKPLTNITEENGLISFDFMDGGPIINAIEGVTIDAATGNEAVSVYSASGALLGTSTRSAFSADSRYPNGAYILKTVGGTVVKVCK